MIRSLRHVDPVSSFRSTFAYTNITHLLGRHASSRRREGAADWNAVLRARPARSARHDGQLHHRRGDRRPPPTTRTATAGRRTARSRCRSRRSSPMISAAPATSTPPSRTWRAGCACSSATARSRAARIVSPENLAVTRMRAGRGHRQGCPTPWAGSSRRRRTAPSSGTTAARSASAPIVGLALDQDVGVVILTNETNVGFPSALGTWILDRMMGNPEVDYVNTKIVDVKAHLAANAVQFAAGEPAAVSAARAARRQLRQPELRQGVRRGGWR